MRMKNVPLFYLFVCNCCVGMQRVVLGFVIVALVLQEGFWDAAAISTSAPEADSTAHKAGNIYSRSFKFTTNKNLYYSCR